jgi:ribosomal protein L37E
MWLVIVVGVFISVGMILVGRRGRRIDSHPVCRKCGFDLFGRPADSLRCAECGADVSEKSAIVIGNYERRPRLIVVGGALLATTLLLGGFTYYVLFKNINLLPYEPLFVLRWDLSHPYNVAAFKEFDRRLDAGQLSESDIAPVMDQFLEWERDPDVFMGMSWCDLIVKAHNNKLLSAARWQRFLSQLDPANGLIPMVIVIEHQSISQSELAPAMDKLIALTGDSSVAKNIEYSNILEKAHNKNLLSAAAWERFLTQSLVPAVTLSPEVRRGAKIPVSLTIGHDGLWIQLFAACPLTVTASARIGGFSHPFMDKMTRSEGGYSKSDAWLDIGDSWSQIADGQQNMQIDYVITLTQSNGVVRTCRGSQIVPVEVVPAGTPLVKVNHDPGVKQAMIASLSLVGRQSTAKDHVAPLPDPRFHFANDVAVLLNGHPPMDGEFAVKLVQGQSQWPLVPILIVSPRTRTDIITRLTYDYSHSPLPDFQPGPAEIVMDPVNLDPDVRTPGLDAVFGEELRFPVTLVRR